MPVTIKAAHLKYKNGQGEYVGVNSVSDETISMVVDYLEQIRDALNNGDIPSAIAILDQAILDLSRLG